jgi:hypothetical protein
VLGAEIRDRRVGGLICCSREFPRCYLFRLTGAKVLRRNSDRIGGFEKGEFERNSARKEVAAQVCAGAGPTRFRAQEIDEPTKIRNRTYLEALFLGRPLNNHGYDHETAI